MESWQARFDSFAKGKRVKKGSSTTVQKWPHPASFLANPETLAEAGFYFAPGPTSPDGVTCFACNKELSDWEPEDDPFAEHVKRGASCCWAIARCGLRDDMDEDGNFTFPDASRLPTSKTMEKARYDSFGTLWPHDAIKGHTANSKKMAKAGFVYTPQGPDDDTATCFYCGTSLSGWDEGDDPLAEHRKREAKSGEPCPFFTSQSTKAQAPPSKAARPSSRSASKPPSKTSAAAKKKAPAPPPDEPASASSSEDEIAMSTAPSNPKPRASALKKSTSSRASSVPAKTPASRKSTRSSKASTSKGTAGSEVEDDVEASGSEAGKRVSKSKRKGQTKAKERIEAIQEEEEDENAEPAEEPVAPPKPKRGRPPKAKAAAKAKQAPVETEVDEQSEEEAMPVKKPAHSRTRSKANVESESDVPKASSSKDVKTKSSTKSKAKLSPVVEIAMPPPPPPTAGSSKGSSRKAPQPLESDDEDDEPIVKPAPARKTSTVSKAKAKQIVQESEDELMGDVEEDAPSQEELLPTKHSTPPPRNPSPATEQKTTKNRKSSSTSDDAGYATAENAMDVDVDAELQPEPAPEPPSRPTAKAHTRSSSSVKPAPEPTSLQRSSSIENAPAPKPPSRQGSVKPVRASSRAAGSIVRSASRLAVEIVDVVSSEDENAPVKSSSKAAKKPATNGTHPMAPQSDRRRAESEMAVDEPEVSPPAEHISPPVQAEKSASKVHKKKQIDVEVAPSSSAARVVSPDVQMDDDDAVPEPLTDSVPAHITPPATPPPRTPPLPPADTEMPPPKAPSAAPALPSFDEELEKEAAQAVQQGEDDSFTSFTPFLSTIPMPKLTSLTEEECDMTLEQYIRREIEIQYQQFKEDAERKIALFQEKAAETRRIIESA